MKSLAFVIVLAHLAAVASPCPSEFDAARDLNPQLSAQHHALVPTQAVETSDHHRPDCGKAPPATSSVQAKCPCGCGGDLPAAAGSTARVGYALFPALAARLADPFCSLAESLSPGDVMAPIRPVDHIPIPFQFV